MQRRRADVAHERADQHHPRDQLRLLRGRPDRGARGHRRADDDARARSERPDQGEHVAADRLRRVVAPARTRLAVAAKIERRHPEARGNERRSQKPIFLAQVAEPGHTDNQRPLALHAVGKPALLTFQPLRRRRNNPLSPSASNSYCYAPYRFVPA